MTKSGKESERRNPSTNITDDVLLDSLKKKEQELEKMQQKEENAKKKEKAQKPMINKTNKMILCAVIFGLLVIACMATPAGLGLAAVAIATAGVGAYGLATAVKGVTKHLNPDPIKKAKKVVRDEMISKIKGNLGKDNDVDEVAENHEQGGVEQKLAGVIRNMVMVEERMQEELKTDINRLETKLYKNIEEVMGDGYTKDIGGVILKADVLIPKLLDEDGLKNGSDKEVTDLKNIMKGYDQKGLKEQKLVLKTLNDIFDKCDDKAGDPLEKDQAGKKKTELTNIIKGNVAKDQSEKDKVAKLITDKKGEFDDKKGSKISKDKAHNDKKKSLGI